jgi:hypothetical protein
MRVFLLLIVIILMGQNTGDTDEPLGARELLKAVAEPQESLSLQAQRFMAYAVLRLHKGKPYLIPRNLIEAEHVDSMCHGSSIHAEYLILALVSSGWLALKKSKTAGATQDLVFKMNAFNSFKSMYPDINIACMQTKSWNKRISYLVVRGNVNPDCMHNGTVKQHYDQALPTTWPTYESNKN